MSKKSIVYLSVVLAFSLILTSVSLAAESQTAGTKARTFWQKLFNYPANVTKESVNVACETGKKGTEVVTKEVKTVGQVTSGELAKTKELVTEPITGTAQTAVTAIKGTAMVPVEAAKEEPAESQSK